MSKSVVSNLPEERAQLTAVLAIVACLITALKPRDWSGLRRVIGARSWRSHPALRGGVRRRALLGYVHVDSPSSVPCRFGRWVLLGVIGFALLRCDGDVECGLEEEVEAEDEDPEGEQDFDPGEGFHG